MLGFFVSYLKRRAGVLTLDGLKEVALLGVLRVVQDLPNLGTHVGYTRQKLVELFESSGVVGWFRSFVRRTDCDLCGRETVSNAPISKIVLHGQLTRHFVSLPVSIRSGRRVLLLGVRIG